MARFDVHLMPSGDLALDCQSDQLEYLASRFTVPLVPEDEIASPIAVLHPTFEVRGERLVMATHLSGAVPARVLGTAIASLKAHEYEIQRAIDTLTGY